MFTLGTAAKAAGVSKSTIHRAIKSGRMSVRDKDGAGYQIDPAELFRVFPPAGERDSDRPVPGTLDQNGLRVSGGLSPLQAHLVRLETELRASKELAQSEQNLLDQLLTSERHRADEFQERADELRRERDRWAGVAEAAQRQLTYLAEQSKKARWWPFGRTAQAALPTKADGQKAQGLVPRVAAPRGLETAKAGSSMPLLLPEAPLL
jgi:hypothetical protein